MIPHKCLVKHDPPNSYGDCFRACIASLLAYPDAEQIPHFYRDGNDERGLIEFKEWLTHCHKLKPFYMAMPGKTPHEHIFEMMSGVNTDIEYLLFCQCGGENHVLICQNDKIIHDPAWYSSQISGPCDNGFWVIVVLVPDDYSKI